MSAMLGRHRKTADPDPAPVAPPLRTRAEVEADIRLVKAEAGRTPALIPEGINPIHRLLHDRMDELLTEWEEVG